MNRILPAVLSLALLLLCSCGPKANLVGTITSVDGEPLRGVLVSDGVDFARSNSKGRYALASGKTTQVVFAITPSGYVAKSSDGLQPAFWAGTSMAVDSCEVHDFVFEKQNQDKYGVVFMTDEHLVNAGELKPDIEWFSNRMLPFVKKRKAAMEKEGMPVFVMNLGDLSHDRYWYERDFDLEAVYEYLLSQKAPCPMYSVSGNHDHDPAVYVEDPDSEEFLSSHVYRKVFGPAYFSFNVGDDHWIVMNNTQYLNVPGGRRAYKGHYGRRNYNREYTQQQMDWLRKDLSYVPEGTKVYFCSHCPVFDCIKEKIPSGQLRELESIFAARNVVCDFFTGHAHRLSNTTREKYPHLNVHVIPATSGNMWTTAGFGRNLSMDGCVGGAFCGVFNPGAEQELSYWSEETGQENYYRAYDLNHVARYMDSRPLMRKILSEIPSKFDYRLPKWKNCVMVNCWWAGPDDKVQMWEGDSPLEVVRDCEISDPVQFCYNFLFKDPMRPDKTYSDNAKEISNLNAFVAKCSTVHTPVKVRIDCFDGKVFEFTIDRSRPFDEWAR